jgi:hypothetical protein
VRVYLYDFNAQDELYNVTNDNINHFVEGITYQACAIESKEVVLDLKEIMGECTVTLPWDQADYLKNCIAYPYDAPIGVQIRSFDTSTEEIETVFKGFVNSVKGSQCQMELGCVSFIEQARDNFPRMYVTRLCDHRLYSELCGLSAANWTDTGNILSISKNRLGFYADVDVSRADQYYRYGYAHQTYAHRWITYSSLVESSGYGGVTSNVVLFNVMHPIPPSWDYGSTVYFAAGCDKLMSTCRNKFNNFVHYLGFPHAPYETIRLTGLKSTEVFTRKSGGK